MKACVLLLSFKSITLNLFPRKPFLCYYILIMKHLNLACILLLLTIVHPVFSQRITPQAPQATPFSQTLVGTKEGLFQMSTSQNLIPIWKEGSVDKIMYADGWFFLTSKGILFSKDLKTFEYRNKGLPFSTIKEYNGITTSFTQQVHPLKDLEFLPGDSRTLVTITKEETFISRNAGLSWQSLGFSARTSGAKAVAVAMLPNQNNTDVLTVFLSHAIYGVAYMHPDQANPTWIDIPTGFEAVPTLDNPDEVADILAVHKKDSSGETVTEVYFTQSFLPRLYKLKWESRSVELIASQNQPIDTWDSLVTVGSDLAFVSMGGIQFFSPTTKQFLNKSFAENSIIRLLNTVDQSPRCAWFSPSLTNLNTSFGLSELWMTRNDVLSGEYTSLAEDKRSIYVPSGQVTSPSGIQKFVSIVEDNDLNSIVIDMKDDKGLLRYQTKDPFIAEKAHVSSYALNIDEFVKTFKEKNIYLIARLVVFKDENLYKYNQREYAVWDNRTNYSWLGVREYGDDNSASYFGEHWVDPYSHEVWEYNIAIAKELIELGFDEIQFDYIRFPTDGLNLSNTHYRWQDEGMDKESALLSFLSYARKNINAPIGIDIYGVNGWYRSGSRTGQDVELIAPYVDVISPMSYPSHFESIFLAYTPIIERPYRIYFYGTYRNAVIARNQVVIRPWLQSFFLSHNSFDEEYYGSNYVQRQVFGVRDATDSGYMYWNNVGRYDEVRPHIGSAEENTPYPWDKAQRDITDTIPVFSNN